MVKEEEQKIIEAEGAIIKTDYTIFSTVALNNFEVVTGWTYDPNNPDLPKYEYCYHSTPNLNGQKTTTDLAKKYENRDIRWEQKIDEDLRRLAKKYCKFR